MGLLDGFGDFLKTPEGQGLLSATFGGLAGARRGAPLNSLGTAGLAGLQGYSGALDRNQQTEQFGQMQKSREMQMQVQQMQMDKARRDAEQEAKQQTWRSGLPAVMAPKYGAGNEGPTLGVDRPGIDNYLMSPDSPYADKMMEQRLFPKADDYKVVGDSLLQVGSGGVKPVFTAPQKPEKTDPNKPFLIVDGKIVPNEAYQAYDLKARATGAPQTKVEVNTGQKGLDNTLKVRGDFRSEPIYKAHQEVQSAYSQIGAGLKAQSPVGDLAAATKIMKLLDPGSVVRESELGMAMAATGLMDRVTNYADMVVKGTKLTPSQRKEFQSLADSLYQESGKQYNGKRTEYQGIAERNGLNTMDILGEEVKPAAPKPSESMPPAQQHKGRMIRDTVTGKTLKSDGMTWKEVQ